MEHKNQQGYKIILGIDANEAYSTTAGKCTPLQYTLEKPISTMGHDGTLATLVCTCGLHDPTLHLQLGQVPPPKYERGKEKVDFLFASAHQLPAVKRAGTISQST